MNIFIGFLNNAAVLMALCIVYEVSYLIPSKFENYKPYLNGVIAAFIGLVIMLFPVHLGAGVIFDARAVLIGVTALVFGAIPTIVVVVVTVIYRLLLGGPGMIPGLLIITSAAVIGLFWRLVVWPRFQKHRWVTIYAMGVAVHLAFLSWVFLFPLAATAPYLAQISFSLMLIFPVATLLLSLLLLHQKERYEALSRVEEAEAKYQSLFEQGRAIMMLMDPEDGRIIDVNSAAEEYYGWSAEEMRNMYISQINILEPAEIQKSLQAAAQKYQNYFIFRHGRSNGRVSDVEVYCGPIRFGNRTLLYSIIHDISQRIASENALRESQENLSLLLSQMQQGLGVHEIILDKKGKPTDYRYLQVNASFEQQTGFQAKKIIGKTIREIAPEIEPYWIEKFGQVALTGEPLTFEEYSKPLKRYYHVVAYSPKPGQFATISTDITEQKNTEKLQEEIKAQSIQQQKLEAIGTLASGVAHEINNPINGIMNYAQLIADAAKEDSGQRVWADEILHETERIASIVKNLLQFSRQEKQSHSYASLYDIVEGTVSLIKTVIKKDQIDLRIELEEDLPDLKCRSQQIQQVIMNLLTNARDALNEKYPAYDEDKIIRLSAEQYAAAGRRWIRIIVEDHGNGIPDDLQEKIFEPFFSTKPKEAGTGLGLSISFGIVKDHHGTITLESESNSYTRFIVDLPVDNGWEL